MTNENNESGKCSDESKKKCMYFHNDPYRTPNNYDLYFDYNNIPTNIELENTTDLLRRLKKHLPLSKLLHLNMENRNIPSNDEFKIHTKTMIKFKKKNVNGKIEEVVVDLR